MCSQYADRHIINNFREEINMNKRKIIFKETDGSKPADAFGNWLKEIRTQKKLTLRELEKLTGLSNSYLSQLERGERGIPRIIILKKISDGLSISLKNVNRVVEIAVTGGDIIDQEWMLPNFAQIIRKYEKLTPENKSLLLDFLDMIFKRQNLHEKKKRK